MLLKIMNSQALNRSVPGVMASEEDVLRATVALCVRVLQARVLDLARKQPRKREWVRKWISRRQAQGASNNFLKELVQFNVPYDGVVLQDLKEGENRLPLESV